MADKFQNKYRIPSARWQAWDYSSDALYFITICTANRACIFGDIVNGEFLISETGKIIEEEWLKSFEIRKELSCDSYVIMPNHIHAILRITVETHGGASGIINYDASGIIIDDSLNSNNKMYHTAIDDSDISDNKTHHRASLRGVAYREPKSISSFVAGFKSVTTTQINKLRNTKSSIWQTRFHDHVIRDYEEHRKIAGYIETNIQKWHADRFKPENPLQQDNQ